MSTEIRRAGIATRILYSAGLFSLLPGILAASSGWVGIALGGFLGGVGSAAVLPVLAAAIVFRIYQVLRYPFALDARASNKFVATFRVLSRIAMLIGGAAGIGLFFVRPLALLVFKTPGDDGIAFFITQIFLVSAASFGWLGCLVFEITRYIGRRPSDAPRSPVFRWKQDVIVASLLVAMFVGGPHLLRATAPLGCGQNRISCIAKLESHIKRVAAAPVDTPIYLESAIHSVRLQVRNGSNVRWEATESPFSSLQAAGYPPSADSTLRLRVKVDAHESSEGIVVGIYVSDGDEETARLAIAFPRGSRLEPDGHGAVNVIAALPWTSDSMIQGQWRDSVGDGHTIDQIFIFLRQAIGTEVEAREHNSRVASTAVLTAHTDHVDVDRSIDEMRLGKHLEVQCGDRITRSRGAKVRSYADADRAWELSNLVFKAAPAEQSQTYVHTTDQIVCRDETTWVVHQVPIETFITLRRYAADGRLLRFVESPLPSLVTEERFAFVDAASVRETADAIWFDRIEVEFGGIGGADKVVGRDTFRIPLTEQQ